MSFLTLPRELRDLIYEHVLLQKDSIITMLDNHSCHKNEIDARPPAICSVNRQVRSETIPIFYSSNVFTAQLDNFYDLGIAKDWLIDITDANVAHLRKLMLRGWSRVPFGHMVSKRWIQVTFDLKAGTMDMESQNGRYQALAGPEQFRMITSSIEDVRSAFRDLVTERRGRPFDGQSVAVLMDSFNSLCAGY